MNADTLLMNPCTGSVDYYENWECELGHAEPIHKLIAERRLIEVCKDESGHWEEVK